MRDVKQLGRWLVLGAALVLGGCATAPDDPYADPRDPFEETNRSVWKFNDALDKAVLKPAALAYGKIPEPGRQGLRNVVDNLEEPASFVNNLLQGKVSDAGVTLWRFTINSTIGLAGLFDVATPMGLTQRQEGFGEVLATWGVGSGPYLMLPLVGPTVPVDRGGDVVDGLYFPLDNLSGPVSAGRWIVKALDTRLRLMEQDRLMENSLDSYSFLREAYFQNWRNKVYDGNPPPEPVPDYEEDLGDDFYDQF
ncbi:hypothetical protein CWE22_05130 [Pseudidiomarina aestuarii]|uniref:ABC transporter n=1 Tax=Pseudidiomarina aestuarii TaxID=624146 RepID=A0A7Z6ZUA3_9GAMM|nr:VacJ family lipoprotein [Pseudidiomarina aestuarii]RUO41547.1 hypothetical protein CWE22_05130 [Pseudidiomarina aestuarii]